MGGRLFTLVPVCSVVWEDKCPTNAGIDWTSCAGSALAQGRRGRAGGTHVITQTLGLSGLTLATTTGKRLSSALRCYRYLLKYSHRFSRHMVHSKRRFVFLVTISRKNPVHCSETDG